MGKLAKKVDMDMRQKQVELVVSVGFTAMLTIFFFLATVLPNNKMRGFAKVTSLVVRLHLREVRRFFCLPRVSRILTTREKSALGAKCLRDASTDVIKVISCLSRRL